MKRFLLWSLACLPLCVACVTASLGAQEDEDPPMDQPKAPAHLVPYNGQVDTSALHWWNNDVWYEVYVRSFRDSDGDGTGDLQGIIEKLDYLNDGKPGSKTSLGVKGLWLMPIFDSLSDHGYDVTDYMKVKADYGTLDTFRTLVKEAHKRGIKVMLDIPFNHVSYKHPWFVSAASDVNSPYRDYFRWSKTPLNKEGPDRRPCWFSTTTKDGQQWYYYGVFNFSLPDLNLENPKVIEEIHKIVKFWVDQGVDAFRLDAVKYFVENGDTLENTSKTYAWLADFSQFYKGLKPDLFVIGETWTSLSAIRQYTGGKIDMGLNFPLQLATISSMHDGTAEAAGDTLFASIRDLPNSQWGTFLTNHDQTRFMTEVDADPRRAKLGATFLLTAPGVPFLYYGEEIGMQGKVRPSDVNVRRPMQWNGWAPGYGFTSKDLPSSKFPNPGKENHVDGMKGDPNSLWSRYRDLIQLRNSSSALTGGNCLFFENTRPKILSYLRTDSQGTYVVILNFSPYRYTDYGLNLWTGPLKAGMKPHVLIGDGLKDGDLQAPVVTPQGGAVAWKPLKAVEPYGSVVIELK